MSQPEKAFDQGSCRAAIFANEIQNNGKTGKIRKVTLQKRYRDKDGNWQNTYSLGVNDIPKAIMVLTKAYEYLTSRESK